ncbi:hypothetical protein AcW1_010341 [Taiwanofungus camphoratus]|nr:hypothetical protein AcV7_005135 [Antrodia cinnamomea]KAI0955476.1 hypothetical protein AcW1_010341 [Antrodia cinnamomea]KAI0955477.1 hypothetical protein AcW1_010341 [Antrodia cinnamomea]
MEMMSSTYSFYSFWIRFRYYLPPSNQSDIIMTDTPDPNYESGTKNTMAKLPGRKYHSAPTATSIEDNTDVPRTPPRIALSTDTGLQATPLKQKAIHSVTGEKGIMDDGLKRYIRAHFRDKVHRGMPVTEFIRAVWDFAPDDIPEMSNYTFPVEYLNWYLRCRYEKDSYFPLSKMLEHILDQITSGTRRQRQSRTTVSDGRLGKMKFSRLEERTVKGTFTRILKPDLAFGTSKSERRRHWEWYLGFIEIKNGDEGPVRGSDFDLSKVAFEKSTSSACAPGTATPSRSVACASRRTSTGTKRKGPASASDDVEPRPKRSRSHANSDEDANMSLSPAAHINEELDPDNQPALTDNEVQAGKYMNELLSHGVRSYATGCMIRGAKVILWYGDRMGIVQSEPFDLRKESRLLLLYLAAMDSADHARMGICPFLKFPSSSYDSYDGVKLELDDKLAMDVNDKPLEKLVFEVDNSRRVITEFGAVGRGTAVVQIKATGAAKAMFGEDDLVAKLAWPSKGREAEDNFIKKIRRKLKAHAPRWLDHVVDLKCSVTRNMKQMDLPRIYMTNLLDYEERVFRIMVMKKYEALEQVNSVDEFKKVFVDVVNAHHWVWETAEVLHRDISAGNIMFYRKDGDVMGILCDWDLAMAKLPENEYAEDNRQSNIFNKPDENDIFGYPAAADNSDVEGQSKQQVKVPLAALNAPDIVEEEDEDGPSPSDNEVHAVPCAVLGADELAQAWAPCGNESKPQVKVPLVAHNAPDIVEEEGEDGPAPSDNEVRPTQEQSRKRPRYRTGTGPFMALDLLAKGNPPLHRYRHDLESFFFVLVWFCAVFDPETHQFRHLSDWESPNLYVIGRNKKAFIGEQQEWEEVFASTHADYRQLTRTWVLWLRRAFCAIVSLSLQIDDRTAGLMVARQDGDQAEVALLNAQITRMKAQKDELMTYEIFMQQLRLPTSSPR